MEIWVNDWYWSMSDEALNTIGGGVILLAALLVLWLVVLKLTPGDDD